MPCSGAITKVVNHGYRDAKKSFQLQGRFFSFELKTFTVFNRCSWVQLVQHPPWNWPLTPMTQRLCGVSMVTVRPGLASGWCFVATTYLSVNQANHRPPQRDIGVGVVGGWLWIPSGTVEATVNVYLLRIMARPHFVFAFCRISGDITEAHPSASEFYLVTIRVSRYTISVFFRRDISVICSIIVWKLALTVFTSLYFRALWPT